MGHGKNDTKRDWLISILVLADVSCDTSMRKMKRRRAPLPPHPAHDRGRGMSLYQSPTTTHQARLTTLQAPAQCSSTSGCFSTSGCHPLVLPSQRHGIHGSGLVHPPPWRLHCVASAYAQWSHKSSHMLVLTPDHAAAILTPGLSA